MSALAIAIGILLCASSGVPSLLGHRAAYATPPLIIAGAITGLTGCTMALLGPVETFSYLRVDALSAFFAAPVFLLAGAGGLYAGRAKGGIFFGLLTAALALVMTSGNTIVFLVGWEIVAVASFFLITIDHEERESREAGWIYLTCSHVATLTLFAIVALLHTMTGSWTFAHIAAGPRSEMLLWLAAVAFGIKAGIMPLHVWLPGAHAAAPTHVSAVMSGVAIKMGIYGLVRILSLYDIVPPAFGITLLLAGIASSILGVAFALAQHDLKRLLAYHSIENIGIIVMGLGIGLVAQANGAPLIAFLGYAGALLHVWNHGLFKALLFLSAGAVVHALHTREIDRMGGAARRMPWTAAAFLIGAVAISGLPPLNGFVSEFLIYAGGFLSITSARSVLLILIVPALALTGALALACFVKAFGAVFLGTPRGESVAAEAAWSTRLAMLPLVGACFAIGLLPAWFGGTLVKAVRIAAPRLIAPRSVTMFLQPVQNAAIVIAIVAILVTIALRARTRHARPAVTWDCGYARPSARMQYTSSSLARGLVAFFGWAMPPVVHAPRTFSLFPEGAAFESHVPDTVLDRALLPALRGAQWLFGFARYIQQGRVQLYLLYLGVTLIALLTWSAR